MGEASARSVLPDPSASCAVLIGAHRFNDPSLQDLPAVRENLRALRRLLTSPGSWDLPDERCVVVEAPDPEGAATGPIEVLAHVEAATSLATDTLLLYYAGHGETCGTDDKLYLTLPDSKKDIDYTMIQYDNLRGILRRSRAKRKVLVLDCCFAGRAFDGRMSGASLPQISEPVEVKGTVMLSAVSETRTAVAPENARFTAYTGALVQALEEGVPGGGEWLTVEVVHDRLKELLTGDGRPEPQISSRNLAHSIVLARNPAYEPAASADPQAQQDALVRFQQLGAAEMVETLVGRLRALRTAAGQPSLRRLARDTGLRQDVIAEALRGSCLPDLLVVTKLVEVLDPELDREAWDSWWSASARRLRKAKAAGECADLTLQPPPPPPLPEEGLRRVTALTRDAEREAGTQELPETVEQALRTLEERLPRHEKRPISSPTWEALRDYLMLVIQLFDPEPFPVHRSRDGSPGRVALVESVLPRLAELAAPDMTRVREWQDLADEIYREFAEEQMSARQREAALLTSAGSPGAGNAFFFLNVEMYALYREHAAATAFRLARLSAPALSPVVSPPGRPATVEDPAPLPTLPEFPGNEKEMSQREMVLPVTLAVAVGAYNLGRLFGLSKAIDFGVGCAAWVVAVIGGFRWLRRRVTAMAEARHDYYRRHRPW
jgi:hypothetical protein